MPCRGSPVSPPRDGRGSAPPCASSHRWRTAGATSRAAPRPRQGTRKSRSAASASRCRRDCGSRECPNSVLIPAPVKKTIRCASSIIRRSSAISGSIMPPLPPAWSTSRVAAAIASRIPVRAIGGCPSVLPCHCPCMGSPLNSFNVLCCQSVPKATSSFQNDSAPTYRPVLNPTRKVSSEIYRPVDLAAAPIFSEPTALGRWRIDHGGDRRRQRLRGLPDRLRTGGGQCSGGRSGADELQNRCLTDHKCVLVLTYAELG